MSVFDQRNTIISIAEMLVHAGLGTMAIVDRSVPKKIRSLIDQVVQEAVLTLEPGDEDELVGYAAIFSRGKSVGDRELALAKTVLAVESAIEDILSQYYRRQDFPSSRLLATIPELRDHLDNEGLLSIELFEPLPDAFRFREFVVYPSEEIPYQLSRAICALAQNGHAKLRFQPAHYCVGRADKYTENLFEEFIFGPMFDFDKFRNKRFQRSEPTELRRFPQDEIEEISVKRHPVEAVQILRTERKSRIDPISMMIEELVPSTTDSIRSTSHVRTRLFHCNIAPDGAYFMHADSSMLLYEPQTYAARLAADLGEKVKAEGHYKLFWIGDVGPETWADLLIRSFPHDELIVEYLTGERQHIGPEASTSD